MLKGQIKTSDSNHFYFFLHFLGVRLQRVKELCDCFFRSKGSGYKIPSTPHPCFYPCEFCSHESCTCFCFCVSTKDLHINGNTQLHLHQLYSYISLTFHRYTAPLLQAQYQLHTGVCVFSQNINAPPVRLSASSICKNTDVTLHWRRSQFAWLQIIFLMWQKPQPQLCVSVNMCVLCEICVQYDSKSFISMHSLFLTASTPNVAWSLRLWWLKQTF